MSRLQQVVGLDGDARVRTVDLDGQQRTVSLLAFEGPTPQVGDWLVAQSGFALGPADAEDARAAGSELARLGRGTGR